MTLLTVIDGKVAYSKGYATLFSKGAPIYPMDFLIGIRLRETPKETYEILRTYLEATIMLIKQKTKGWLNPLNRLTPNRSGYTQEFSVAMSLGKVPPIPLRVSQLEAKIVLRDFEEGETVEILIEKIIKEWEKTYGNH